MKGEKTKRLRLLRLWEMLNTESDEDNPLGTEEIRRRLAEFDIECDRRTLYNDIETLQSAGFEIFCHRGKSNQYYVVDRKFSVPEILIVMDAVQAASFITEKKTADLVNKVGSLAGSRKGEVLQKNVVQFSTVKSNNESIYYSVNEICQAISNKKKISFNYFDYDVSYNRNYRPTSDGKPRLYVVSPVATVFSNDNYYLFCYDDKHMNITQYRVDRMSGVSMLDEDITPNENISNFDISTYKKQLFGMYGGEETEIRIEADKGLIDVIHDKFGSSVRLYVVDEKTIGFCTKVQVSPTFFAWCCSFGKNLRLVSPDDTVKELRNYIKSLHNMYK